MSLLNVPSGAAGPRDNEGKEMFWRLLNPKRWWFFGSIVWRVFAATDDDAVVVRVPASVAFNLAFRCPKFTE